MIPRRCHECGTGQVVPTGKKGRMERFHSAELEIPEHVKIPTCNKCGAEWMDPATALAIDEALSKIYYSNHTKP